MRKILVIGPGGAGKSTFARRLGDQLNLGVIHLDSLYWKPGWVESPKQEWIAIVDALIARESWIIDGNYSGTLERRVMACDAVIFLDLPRLTCMWRVVQRVLRYRNATRPDMAQHCPERLSIGFLVWIWNYRKRTRPKVLGLLNEFGGDKKVVWLKSSAEAERYLAQLHNEVQTVACLPP